jgi:hypothetical protein
MSLFQKKRDRIFYVVTTEKLCNLHIILSYQVTHYTLSYVITYYKWVITETTFRSHIFDVPMPFNIK